MSFGRNAGSRLILPWWAGRTALFVLMYLLALGLGYVIGVLIRCASHGWCPP